MIRREFEIIQEIWYTELLLKLNLLKEKILNHSCNCDAWNKAPSIEGLKSSSQLKKIHSASHN